MIRRASLMVQEMNKKSKKSNIEWKFEEKHDIKSVFQSQDGRIPGFHLHEQCAFERQQPIA